MPRTEDGQYELVLENRQVLGIFFVAAVLCGVFFALGYIVGRNTAAYEPRTTPQAAASAEGKRSPMAPPQAAAPAKAPETQEAPAADAGTQPPAAAEKAPAPAGPAAGTAAVPAGAILLQVAALSKKEDADAMVALLKKKDFDVTVTNPGDKLHHVMVGPFVSLKDAEGVKARLEKEGFKPIVKR